MADVTEADREKAAEILKGDIAYHVVRDAIAAALAEEREKARAGVVQAQVNVLRGLAGALSESVANAPSEIMPGLRLASRIADQTADRISREYEVAP